MSGRRLAAGAALVLGAVAAIVAVGVSITHFPDGLAVFACGPLAVAAAWYGLVRRGAARMLGLGAAALLLAGALILVAVEETVLQNALILGALLLSLVAARAAFTTHVRWPPAPRPRHPVLFMNPHSGSGKAERFHLADEARARGIEPVEFHPGDDLRELVEAALANGADALAMAGGDGSQAIVAAIAAERGLPYACIPTGTRNHFALDLGVDRRDVVGALDSLVDGGERRVDLAEVNGRVFVNNVSLGPYAEALQRSGYRDAKLRTLLDTVPDALGPSGGSIDLRWTGPDGHEHRSGAAILVSNNPYRLGHAIGSGTRPRLDGGVLGMAVATPRAKRDGSSRALLREWSAPEFEVAAERPVIAGIDGEAAVLDPPIRFRIRPAALRVRIAPAHNGISPSAVQPEGPLEAVRDLARLALGRDGAGA